jgi:hypothetical protein
MADSCADFLEQTLKPAQFLANVIDSYVPVKRTLPPERQHPNETAGKSLATNRAALQWPQIATNDRDATIMCPVQVAVGEP